METTVTIEGLPAATGTAQRLTRIADLAHASGGSVLCGPAIVSVAFTEPLQALVFVGILLVGVTTPYDRIVFTHSIPSYLLIQCRVEGDSAALNEREV